MLSKLLMVCHTLSFKMGYICFKTMYFLCTPHREKFDASISSAEGRSLCSEYDRQQPKPDILVPFPAVRRVFTATQAPDLSTTKFWSNSPPALYLLKAFYEEIRSDKNIEKATQGESFLNTCKQA